jgi:hypothetical protein
VLRFTDPELLGYWNQEVHTRALCPTYLPSATIPPTPHTIPPTPPTIPPTPPSVDPHKCDTKESTKLTSRCEFTYIIHVPWLQPPAVDSAMNIARLFVCFYFWYDEIL